MWEEEDNNPYASSGGGGAAAFVEQYPLSSGDESPEFSTQAPSLSDVEYDNDNGNEPASNVANLPMHTDFESLGRIEKILYTTPHLISIIDAGKPAETGGDYIVYTIEIGNFQVPRRYSDFLSLRQTLVRLHPTLIIPPIPEKHTIADYASNPRKAKTDRVIIEHRKRMLESFLKRCAKMNELLEDGVWWRFLDPNVSWEKVKNTPPVSTIPQNILLAPPLNPSNPEADPAYAWLPTPSSSAKLKSYWQGENTGLPLTVGQAFGNEPPSKFPPADTQAMLSEEKLDPYFIGFEASSKELETLLVGNMEKSNRRMIAHWNKLANSLKDFGVQMNSFSLSEQRGNLAEAEERIGQATDHTYYKTLSLATELSEKYAEPMRESAQFAGIVRSVLRYRVLKRIQEEMARSGLEEKTALLTSLQGSEEQSKRVEARLNKLALKSTNTSTSTSVSSPANSPHRTNHPHPNRQQSPQSQTSSPLYSPLSGVEEDVASVDSDFPPSHGELNLPSAPQGEPTATSPTSTSNHPKKTGFSSGGASSISTKLFGSIRHAFQGFTDSDPIRTRQDQITRTREQIKQLQRAIEITEGDVKDASQAILNDLRRFQVEKEQDLTRYMVDFAKSHIEWAKKNLKEWTEAQKDVKKIDMTNIVAE